ncbi:AraC family transcriptional regulator [Cerasibacillus terrae]|uniref:AraC family transcriptional regulator n=1 Tax=Cerasibacillus terrae TaxID=2498845 RepID=A0A5C8NKT3_9BACI|nr:AraC family transcriptional regulator [Cerasibacillus terrae]TXL61093.1 AraC family transcriptional regulator [Cerasibacillus terrae]
MVNNHRKKGKILPSVNSQQNYSTYGFLFRGEHIDRIAGIHTLGWEIRKNSSYYLDGLTRSEVGKVIFQYTLKGRGEIKLNNKIYQLNPGNAFFVKIPSNHQYYLPEDSKEWEFVHITLFGEESHHIFNSITEEFGHILNLELNAKPIQLIFKLYEKAIRNEIRNSYEASSFAYSFLMGLKSYSINQNFPHDKVPITIIKAVQFIHSNYRKQITLNDIAESSNLSKYYLSRLFSQTMNITPLQYLTQFRMSKALELLNDGNLTVEDIASKVGYSNGNYFTKVFRSKVGISPGKYRNKENFVPFDKVLQHLTLFEE